MILKAGRLESHATFVTRVTLVNAAHRFDTPPHAVSCRVLCACSLLQEKLPAMVDEVGKMQDIRLLQVRSC